MFHPIHLNLFHIQQHWVGGGTERDSVWKQNPRSQERPFLGKSWGFLAGKGMGAGQVKVPVCGLESEQWGKHFKDLGSGRWWQLKEGEELKSAAMCYELDLFKRCQEIEELIFYYTWLMDCVSLIQFSFPFLSIPGDMCHFHSKQIHTHLGSTSLNSALQLNSPTPSGFSPLALH